MNNRKELHVLNGKKYFVWRAPECDVMVFERKQKLWYVEDESHELFVCGVKTKREALAIIRSGTWIDSA